MNMDNIQELMKDLKTLPMFKTGGGIHIKPENKGKFTETMKRTGKTAEELSHSKNELTRKRAQFALNARKWKHQEGGILGKVYYKSSEVKKEEPYKYYRQPLPGEENYEELIEEAPEEVVAEVEERPVTNPTPTSPKKETSLYYKAPKPTSKEQWVKDMYTAYIAAGVSPSLATVLIAQDATETAYGRKTVGNYNYGNIHAGKNWSGAVAVANDKDANGNPYSARFRSYANLNSYIADKVSLLNRLYDITNSDTPETVKAKLEGNNRNGYRYAEAGQASLLTTAATISRMLQA